MSTLGHGAFKVIGNFQLGAPGICWVSVTHLRGHGGGYDVDFKSMCVIGQTVSLSSKTSPIQHFTRSRNAGVLATVMVVTH